MNVLTIIASFLTVAASPGGQAALEKFFVDHSISLAELDKVIAALKDAPDPHP